MSIQLPSVVLDTVEIYSIQKKIIYQTALTLQVIVKTTQWYALFSLI